MRSVPWSADLWLWQEHNHKASVCEKEGVFLRYKGGLINQVSYLYFGMSLFHYLDIPSWMYFMLISWAMSLFFMNTNNNINISFDFRKNTDQGNIKGLFFKYLHTHFMSISVIVDRYL